MRIIDTLDLLNPPPGTVLGNHAVWLPSLGVKLPWQWGGRITKRTRQEATYPLDTIVDEVQIMRALAAEGMAPPVGDLVYIRNVISDYPGAWHCDPCGTYGYEIADARTLPPGRFSVEAMRQLPIEGSSGAWSDISVAGRDNVVNGYLVDVRRTAWDMLRWQGERFTLPDGREDGAELRARVHQECQFPPGEREVAYQDFWLGDSGGCADDHLVRGQRRVTERAQALGLLPGARETVLDIGCQSGGFLQYAMQMAQVRAAGVEVNAGYVACARALARSCGMTINIRQMDVIREWAAFLAWVRAIFPSGVDHLLLLSMEKHLGEQPMFQLVDAIGARRTYIETNAVRPGQRKLWPEVERRGGIYLGDSEDRNRRNLYRIERAR